MSNKDVLKVSLKELEKELAELQKELNNYNRNDVKLKGKSNSNKSNNSGQVNITDGNGTGNARYKDKTRAKSVIDREIKRTKKVIGTVRRAIRDEEKR